MSQLRALTTKRGQVPVEQFVRLRDFYARVRASEDAPIVLARQ